MPVPPHLQQIVDRFAAAPRELRVQALLEYANRVPPLPAEYAEHRERMEQVHECQTPFFLASKTDSEGRVRISFDCPPEAPTVRGFAGILHAGLDGEPVEAVLAVPADFYRHMGLSEVVSVLRLRGMGAILARLKRQLSEQAVSTSSEEDENRGPTS